MNGVLGMTDVLLGMPLAPEPRQYVQTMRDSAESLLHVINDVLDFSKMEAGKLHLDLQPFAVRPLVGSVVETLAVQARRKGLCLACAVSPAVPERLVGDNDRIRQILINLVGNAIKFTEKGEVTITVAVVTPESDASEPAGSAHVSFEVRDTGIGIPLDKQQLIFEAFTQADGSTTRRYGGTGLGLSISQRLVQLMQGRLQLESAPGAGSAFSFTLPLAIAPEVDGERAVETEAVDECTRTLRLLLAEDNPVNQRVACAMLRRRGHLVVVANNGREAVEAAAAHEFDVVLMDVQMPELGGLDATREIRALERERGGTRRVPIIALTAHAMAGDRERCLAADMDGYLAKPIRYAALMREVERFTLTDSPSHAA